MITAKSSYHISLVITTLGRTTQLFRLFDSVARQSFTDFEVIVVDQNVDDRLGELFSREWPFQLTRIRMPVQRGVSLGRNIGWQACTGTLIVFPDDDCWYPPSFLASGIQRLSETGADILTGRAADETGRSINGRYAAAPHEINKANVWISGIEWSMIFKKNVLETVGGFDERIGIGASTPWQSCEGQDLILRALAKGFKCYFDPSFFGHHEELNVVAPDRAMNLKGRAYGRGLGYVLRTHDYSKLIAAVWVIRPLARAGLNLFRGNFKSLRYLLNVSLGRLEGALGRTYPF